MDDSSDAPGPRDGRTDGSERTEAADRLKWQLISVLFSTQPLTPSLARVLFDAAWELYRSDQGSVRIDAPLVQGRLENLRKDMLLGTVAGPAFEATVDTERGTGTVRFMITRQGLDYMAQRLPEHLVN